MDIVSNIVCWDIFTYVLKKVKSTVVQTLRLCTGRTTHRGTRGIALLFLDHGTRRGEGSASRPGRSLPPWKTRYPLYRRLGGPQGRSGHVWKISPHRDSIPGPSNLRVSLRLFHIAVIRNIFITSDHYLINGLQWENIWKLWRLGFISLLRAWGKSYNCSYLGIKSCRRSISKVNLSLCKPGRK